MTHMVIATDGSGGSSLAVASGVDLARSAGATVTFVHVLPRSARQSDIPVTGEVGSQGSEAGRSAVEAALAAAREAGVPADFQYLEGDPAEVIVRYAREHDADLIVVGSRGLGSVAGLILGSVSRSVVDHADRPVLVVKRHREGGAT